MKPIYEITLTVRDGNNKSFLALDHTPQTENLVHCVAQFNMILLQVMQRIHDIEKLELELKRGASDDIPF